MQRHISIILLLVCLIIPTAAEATTRLITPHWNTFDSDFRHATIDDKGNLTDSYTHMDEDTVNVIDIGASGEYALNINVHITNLHEKPYTSYPQYYYNSNGTISKGSPVERPIYGWVIGMKDMQHYNAILMRPAPQDDELYEVVGVEYRVVTINGNDTIYYSDWKTCYYNDLVNKSSQYNMWIQYRNNTLWFGGGWSNQIPWDIVYNIPSFGSYTGLYLSAGVKVSIEDAFIIVEDKESQPHLDVTAAMLNSYYRNNSCAFVEGFWDVALDNRPINRIKMGGKYSLGILYNGYNYYMIYLDGAEIYPGKWSEGDIKGILTPTAAGYYNAVWYDAEGNMMDNILAFLNGNELTLDFVDDDTRLTLTRSKQYITPTATITRSSGSGFALSSDGYIATNHHVIRNAREIEVYCPNTEFQETFKAEVIAVDSINDLAIIHINDDNFVGFDELPYSISDRVARMGETIFYLGYPIPQIIGTELKTSIGEINATNGLRHSQYMVSVDIDRGSSGSPLFDNEGNIIGVIVSHLLDEYTDLNANYAIKSSYLIKLAEEVEGLDIQHDNKTKELSHPDRIEAIAPFVYLLRVTH
ncbi:MAG: trypsin-like peptidase domain-containing protein [Bacteroidaceae bacterium]|nr:trypsin-like peptidase domain-containing protein [Bacteroidaceae bacterium]